MKLEIGDYIICKKEFTLASNVYLVNRKYDIRCDVVIDGERIITIRCDGSDCFDKLGYKRRYYNITETILLECFETKWCRRKRIIDEL